MIYEDPYDEIDKKDLYLKDTEIYTDETRKKIADRINNLITEKNLTQIFISNYIGISDRTLSRVLNAKSDCAISYLYEIAQILNVSMDYLCFGKPSLPSIGELAELLSDRSPAELAMATRVLKAVFNDDNDRTDRR